MKLNPNEWYLLTNYHKNAQPHVDICLEASKLRHRIEEDAYDKKGILIPDYKALYIPVTDIDSLEHERYWDCCGKIAEEFKKQLIEQGFITPEFAHRKVFMVGTERDYGIDVSKKPEKPLDIE